MIYKGTKYNKTNEIKTESQIMKEIGKNAPLMNDFSFSS
jgi:hypothetical protein